MMASYLKSQWNPGVRIIILFCFCCCFCCWLENKSFNLDSFIDLFSSELWFYRGSGGVDIVLIGGWRPRLFVLFNINLCVQGRTSNNSIIEVKFLSITWAELVIFWATLLLRFLTSGVAGWSSDGGIKSYDISDVC